ncbi:MAG: hypothetical protein RJA22_3225 [Verrucomicrobiota bacterium]|jgi:hypothetical protein
MRAGITPKSIALAFVIVAALYFGVFAGIEHLRHRQGPWQATFALTPAGEPTVTLQQAHRGLTDVRLVFHGETTTNAPGTVRFDRVQQAALFGRVIYEDLTFLPGVVTFDLFGHEVELLPRALIVNRRAVGWTNGMTIELWPTNKPAQPPQPPRKKGR